jgi:hypothetical protein
MPRIQATRVRVTIRVGLGGVRVPGGLHRLQNGWDNEVVRRVRFPSTSATQQTMREFFPGYSLFCAGA